jgi:hypothetical protein
LRLPAIHLVFGLAKRWLLGTHHGTVGPKHLPAYHARHQIRADPAIERECCFRIDRPLERHRKSAIAEADARHRLLDA